MSTRAEFALTQVLAVSRVIILEDGSEIRRMPNGDYYLFGSDNTLLRSADTIIGLLIDISSDAWFGNNV